MELQNRDEFRKIVCGQYNRESVDDLCVILNHIGDNIDYFYDQSINMFNESDRKKISYYGPYCSRGLLEIACNALIARLDPYRILIVKRVQIETNYNAGKSTKSRIQWSGDVLSDSPATNLWDQEKIDQRITRALLGSYMEELVLRPAFLKLIDTIPEDISSDWIEQLRKIKPEGLANFFRSKATELYPKLSKGVHQEYVVPISVSYDRNEIINSVILVIQFIAQLSLISHFVPFAFGCITAEEAIDCFRTIEQIIGELESWI